MDYIYNNYWNSSYANSSSVGLQINGSIGINLVIVNNFIKNQYSSSYGYAVRSSSSMSNAYLANNHYYCSTFSRNLSTSTLLDNVSANYSYNANTGILSGGSGLGLDMLEYRNIDNTVNDIGTNGGPHAWSNYHTTTGKAAIFDLDLPFQLFIGGTHSIKAKAIHKN
jgi:hypothetical protein